MKLYVSICKFSSQYLLVQSNNRSIISICKICSKLTVKTPERHQWGCTGVFIVNFEQISQPTSFHLLVADLYGWSQKLTAISAANHTAQKIKFSIKDFFNLRFFEENFNWKLDFFVKCQSVSAKITRGLFKSLSNIYDRNFYKIN